MSEDPLGLKNMCEFLSKDTYSYSQRLLITLKSRLNGVASSFSFASVKKKRLYLSKTRLLQQLEDTSLSDIL